jgi:hypothetical protein
MPPSRKVGAEAMHEKKWRAVAEFDVVERVCFTAGRGQIANSCAGESILL